MGNEKSDSGELPKKKAEGEGPWYGHLAQPLAILFWLYAITQIFVFDVDAALQSRLPLIAWAIKFKFAFILGIIALVWSFTKSTGILLGFLYIALYPLLIVIWTIPRFIWKQRSWNLTIAYINTILSTTKSLKYGAIIFAMIIIESVLIFQSRAASMLWLAVILCVITVFSTFFHRFVLIFRPSVLYETHSWAVSGVTKFGRKSFSVDKSIKGLPAEMMLQTMTPSERTAWANNLQYAIILNRGCKFLSRKIEDYQRSRLTGLFYAFNFLMLTAVSIYMFSLINYGLYKIDHSSYAVTVQPGFFIFFYYSANTLWGHGIGEVVASSNVARVFFLGELFITFLLVVILLTLWSSVKNVREADEIARIISRIRGEGEGMALFIRDEYGFSVEDAISRLVAANLAGLLGIINFLSEHEERAIPASNDGEVPEIRPE